MSTETSRQALGRLRRTLDPTTVSNARSSRLLALGSSLLLVGSFLRVPIYVTDVVGGTAWLAVLVGAAIVLATVLAAVLPDGVDLPVGLAVGLGIFVAGLGGYLLLIPDVYYALFTIQRVYQDTIALLAGQSVLLLLNADLWAIGIAPGPVFLTWYFALRRHYELAAIAGGVTLGFFTLTGDASATATIVGMTGALGTLGFGSIDRWDGTWGQMQDLGLVLVAAVLAVRFIDLVPDGRESINDANGAGATLEGTLVGAPGQVPVVGSITLSPKVRFTVEADTGSYWRVASYDRYTGQGWVSTSDVRPYREPLPGPPGDASENVQVFQFEASSRAMPAAWKPVYVGGSQAEKTVVADDGGFQPENSLRKGDSYRIVSRIPEWTEDELRESERAYPAVVRDRYLQLPESTPSRLRSRAREITADADGPYDATTTVRDWLESEKTYSLSVPRLGSDVADRFVFDLDRGYCVHFATALTVMLRSIGVPARFVVGYTTGERVEENRYRVRGLHSHAWTEVFFSETGWVTFDPTPSGPREGAREERLEGSGQSSGGEEGTPDSEGTTTDTVADETNDSGPSTAPGSPDGIPSSVASSGEDILAEGTGPEPGRDIDWNGTGTPPSDFREEDFGTDQSNTTGSSAAGTLARRTHGADRLTLLAGAVGLTIGAHRIGLFERVYRSVWIRRQETTGVPESDMRRAFERLEYLLAREHRDRKPDETPRAYVNALEEEGGVAIDERVHRVLELYELIRYSDDPRPEQAAEAIELVDQLVVER